MGLSLREAIFSLPSAYRAASKPRLSWPISRYHEWSERLAATRSNEEVDMRSRIERMRERPHFHVCVLSAGREGQLSLTMDSLAAQPYQDFTVRVLNESEARNGLAGLLADEDWLLLLRAGDRLSRRALYEFAAAILAHPGAAMIYSDDDAIDAAGCGIDPRFKPDWSISHLRATDYIGNAAVFLADAVKAAGNIPLAGEASLYDIKLRVAEQITDNQVAHIPSVLLHRATDVVGTQNADESSMQAVREHLSRCGMSAEVFWARASCWRVKYDLPAPMPLVSIIVPTRDAEALLRQCIESLQARTTYRNLEILVVDNRSADTAALAYLSEISGRLNVRVLRYDHPFNYSAINNFAVREARGELICLLNNDTEIISPDWLEEMVGHLVQDRVGVVGAKLYYPDGRVQHAGDTVGPGGCANHLHSLIAQDAPGYCNRAAVAQELSAVTAACLLTRRDLYLQLGGLNEKNLPVAFNDVDYCLRVREAGYKVVWTPHAELYHHESVSRGKDKTLMRKLRAKREARYMRQRWREAMRNDPFYNPNFSYGRPDFVLAAVPLANRQWDDER